MLKKPERVEGIDEVELSGKKKPPIVEVLAADLVALISVYAYATLPLSTVVKPSVQ